MSFRDCLISEWEKNTDQTWPQYSNDILNGKGIRIARKGHRYHVHYIIPLQLGGSHEWWNIHPIPIDKLSDIHGPESQLAGILEGMKEEK